MKRDKRLVACTTRRFAELNRILCSVWAFLCAIGWRRSLSVRRRWFLAWTGCVFWASLSLRMRGILWANLSLWTGVVLTTRRVLPLRCTRRARYVGRWHRHTRLGFIAERRVLPLRRIRRTRHLRTWCQSPTRLGFRPRRFVILTRGTRVGRSWWTYAVLRNRVR